MRTLRKSTVNRFKGGNVAVDKCCIRTTGKKFRDKDISKDGNLKIKALFQTILKVFFMSKSTVKY